MQTPDKDKSKEDGFSIQFIPLEQREKVLNLMQILSINMKEAYDLFLRAGQNVKQMAINYKTNPTDSAVRNHMQVPSHLSGGGLPDQFQDENNYDFPIINGESISRRPTAILNGLGNIMRRGIPLAVEEESQFDAKFNRFLKAKRENRTFEANYKIRRQESSDELSNSNSISAGIFKRPQKNRRGQKSAKSNASQAYLKKLQNELLQKRLYIKFQKGTASQAVQQSFKKTQPILIHHFKYDITTVNENLQDDQPKKEVAKKEKPKEVANKRRSKRNQNKLQKSKSPVVDLTGQSPSQHIPENLQLSLNSSSMLSFPSNNSFSAEPINYDKDSDKNDFLKAILLNKRYQEYVNSAYVNFIYDADRYDMENFLKEFLPQQKKDESYLTVLRVNAMSEIQLVGRVSLDDMLATEIDKVYENQLEYGNMAYENDENGNNVNAGQQEIEEKPQSVADKAADRKSKLSSNQKENLVKDVLNRLKYLKKKCIDSDTEDGHLRKRYQSLMRGIYDYDYKKPLTTSQKKKQIQDRQLIKQQEEEFLNIEKAMLQQRNEEMSKQQKQVETKITEKQILQRRAQVRQKLKIYKPEQEGIVIVKVRLPSGKQILISVSKKQKVQYLYDYVYSLETPSLGFEKEEDEGYCQRKFDLIRPQDRLNLTERIDDTLDEVFEGSTMESLAIKEK